MSALRGWSLPALVAAGIGAGAAYASGITGAGSLAVVLAAILIAYGRGAGWALSRSLEKPRLFLGLSIAYLAVFLADLGFSLLTSPVSALARLVVFLLSADLLSGDPSRAHRPVLLGLLLVVCSAAETTEVWFFAPLVGFAAAAVLTQLRATMLEDQPAGGPAAPPVRTAPVVWIVAGSLALGGLLFLAIPRVGAGWGRRPSSKGTESSIETGLADAVPLGTVGQVKKRGRMAFTARLEGAQVDPESIYWRARAYSRWTGDGWIKEGREHKSHIDLLQGRAVWVPGLKQAPGPAGLVADIEMKLENLPALLAPGRPVWVRSAVPMRMSVGADGSLSAQGGRIPRRYQVGVAAPGTGTFRIARRSPRRTESGPSSPAGQAPPISPDASPPEAGAAGEPASAGTAQDQSLLALWLDTGRQEAAVRRWAAGVAPGETDPRRLALAFVAELSQRPYSLDTGRIDPGHPIASFLGGAPAHCEYFASAMAIGLRLRGIPARVVSGYLGADTIPFSSSLVVRESRAHLWVEARIPGKGWVTFDPTPVAGREAPSEWSYLIRGGWERIVLAWDSMVIGLDIQDQADLALVAKELVLGLVAFLAHWRVWLALGAMALGAGTVILLRRRRGGIGRKWTASGDVPPFYRRLLALAERKGVRRGPAETAREFIARAASAFAHPDDLRLVSRFYERERFGGRPPDRAEQALIRAALARLSRAGR